MSKPKIILLGLHQHIVDANAAYFSSWYDVQKGFTSPDELVSYLSTDEAKGVQAIVVGGGFPDAVTKIKEAAKEHLGDKAKVLTVPPGTLERVGPQNLKTFIKEELLDKQEW